MNGRGTHWALSAVLSTLPLDFEAAARSVADLGFVHVDVTGLTDRPATHLEALADTGLLVSCGSLGSGLPPNIALESPSLSDRRMALDLMKQQIGDLARLGAARCSIAPGKNVGSEAKTYFAEGCSLLADFAAQRMMQLCIEHRRKTVLPSAAVALEWLELQQHQSLQLLLDIQEWLAADCAGRMLQHQAWPADWGARWEQHKALEDMPAKIIDRSARRLGYISLPCLHAECDSIEGFLNTLAIEGFFNTLLTRLRAQDYKGSIALTTLPTSDHPVQDLRSTKGLIEWWLARKP